MIKTLSILLIEDDKLACKEITAYTNMLDDVFLAGVTDNSHEAIEIVKKTSPNVIILELELNNGKGNGITFLQELKSLKSDRHPYILVTTNNTSAVTYDCARNLGADFIMSKHQADYSAVSAIDFLRSIKNLIINKSNDNTANKRAESSEQIDKKIHRIIYVELNQVGINPKSLGYKYLTDAIYFLVKKEHPGNPYCEVGKKYNKTVSSVERAMQNAINRAWQTNDIEDLLTHYTAKIRPDRGVPTIAEFTYYYANKVQNEL